MKKTYRTAKGQELNMEELRQANESKVASGNAGLNARGDRLGPGGTVQERVAERARQYAQSHAPKRTSVKPPIARGQDEASLGAEPIKPASPEPVRQETIDDEGNITVESTPRKKGSKKSDD